MFKNSGIHIHIVGCSPRSGTTLMQEMMVACYRIDHHCEHERSLFKEKIRFRGVTCTKHPHEVQYAGGALRANKNLYFIYMVRDPRDVVVSRHANFPGAYFTGLDFYLRAERCASRLVDHPRFIVVRYEDLVRSPDSVQEFLERRLPFLERLHRFSEFHLHAKVSQDSSQALNGVRPPDAKSIGGWRNHLPRVSAQLRKFPAANEVLIRYGYEQSTKWTEILPPANDQDALSVISERDGLKNAFRMKWKVIRRTSRYWLRLKAK